MPLMLLIPGSGAPAVGSMLSIGIQSIGRGTPSKASNVLKRPFWPVFWSKADASILLMPLMLLIPGSGAPAVGSMLSIGIQSIGPGTPIKSIKSIKRIEASFFGRFFGLKGMLRYV